MTGRDVPTRPEADWSEPPADDMTITTSGLTHRIHRVRTWRNTHGAIFTDWVAPCGRTDTGTGRAKSGHGTFGIRANMLRKMACGGCWPGVR